MIQTTKRLVREFFDAHGEGSIHGYDHALEVMEHSLEGIKSYPSQLSRHRQLAILLAALLHDVDDEKMFPLNRNFENARFILNKVNFPYPELVIEMIDLVSFSKNGISTVYKSKSRVGRHTDMKPKTGIFADDTDLFEMRKKRRLGTQHRIPKWKLIPRLADRVVALGTRGVGRCLGFGGQHQRLLYTEHTPRFENVHQLYVYAIRAWLLRTSPPKASSIDYFIFGLVPRCLMMSGLKYFDDLTISGTQPIIDVIMLWSSQGHLTKEQILELLRDDPQSIQMIQQYL